MTIYNRTINNTVKIGKLHDEIDASPNIDPPLTGIYQLTDTSYDFDFDGSLTVGEETELDAIIAAHSAVFTVIDTPPAAATATSNGNSVMLRGGAGGSTSGDAGAVQIFGGIPTDGNGGNISILGGDGVGTDREGGDVNIRGGTASGPNTGIDGGFASLRGGTGPEGGSATVEGGISLGAGTAGGPLTLRGGAATNAGVGGAVSIAGGFGATAAAGGNVNINGGIGGTSGNGGTVVVTGGVCHAASSTGIAGNVIIDGGDGLQGNQSGGHVTIQSGSSVGTGTPGTTSLLAGNNGTSVTGGSIVVTAGRSVTGTGGNVTVSGGAGGTTSGNAGSVTVQGGTPVDGNGGNISIQGSDGVGTNRFGGDVTIDAGDSTGNVEGGEITIRAGATNSGTGGEVTILAGSPTGLGSGGAVNIFSGSSLATGVMGGSIFITAGSGGATSGAGGQSQVKGGSGTGTGVGGLALLQGGVGGSTSGQGGLALVQGGAGGNPNGDGGDVWITAGSNTGAGTDGNIRITAGIVRLEIIGSSGAWELEGNAGTAGHVFTSNGSSGPPTWQAGGGGGSSSMPRGHIWGLTMSNAADAANDITVDAGEARSEDGTTDMVLANAITKRLDATWAVGTGNGGLNTGAEAANTWYEVHLIKRTDTNVVDVMFTTTANRATLPTNYTKHRRIGWIRNSAGSAILAFTQVDDYIALTASAQDLNSVAMTTTAANITMTAPPNSIVRFRASIEGDTSVAANTVVTFYELAQGTITPSGDTGLASLGVVDAVGESSGHFELRVNASSQIAFDCSIADVSIDFNVSTFGWIDNRCRLSNI